MEKKLLKKVVKQEKLKKIKNDRIVLNQDLGWLFRPLALCPFPSKPLPKRIILEGKVRKQEHGVLWERKAGKIKVEILGHPKHGVPYGQDTLIILFLAIESRKQGKRKIKIDFYRDFCRMFGITSTGGSRYKNVVNSLNRIRHSQYNWEDENDPTRQKGVHYIYIEELDLYCDPKNPDQKPLFNQYILLSERFWDEINKHKIPFNLEAIKYLKGRAGHLNFYIWLSYRVSLNYLKNKEKSDNYIKKLNDPSKKELMAGGHAPEPEKEFITFWGENGLVNQLSTQIKRRPTFRLELKKWIAQAKELWPNCPVEIDSNNNALTICCTDPKELDVQLNPQIEAGREIRKAIEEEKKAQKKCPNCEGQLKFSKGKKGSDGRRWNDYFHCYGCGENFGKNKYPELF